MSENTINVITIFSYKIVIKQLSLFQPIICFNFNLASFENLIFVWCEVSSHIKSSQQLTASTLSQTFLFFKCRYASIHNCHFENVTTYGILS